MHPQRNLNSFNTFNNFTVKNKKYSYYSLPALKKSGFKNVVRLPFSLKILLENLLRFEDGYSVKKEDIRILSDWVNSSPGDKEISFMPSRILMQDFTGVPAITDIAAMREAFLKMGKDPYAINPMVHTDIVIDHSVQVDDFGNKDAFLHNIEMEYKRNSERYKFLKWGQKGFKNFSVVPPDTGIVHQINLEHLGQVVIAENNNGILTAYPDTLVGMDSHTPMINGLGILGWGVGGIEAEAAMLGQPISMLIPEVVGVKIFGKPKENVTATDIVLAITKMLRLTGVVGKFVEFYGDGLSHLSVPDRATISNMAPEYGATIGFFPVDEESLNYLKLTGRPDETINLVSAYTKTQGLFRTDDMPDPIYSKCIEFDISKVNLALAGPKRPQDLVPLEEVKDSFNRYMKESSKKTVKGNPSESLSNSSIEGVKMERPIYSKCTEFDISKGLKNFVTQTVSNGSVVIAAITSCTNTSNPPLMIAAGLTAKKCVEAGLITKPWVKTSLAPGSKAVTEYLYESGLISYLEKLGFHLVAYGCTTCIGNSGPLPENIAKIIKEENLTVASVLSGNRNFEGRINPLVKANYLASPPLVVAYAICGRIDINLYEEPIGTGKNGKPVYLKDVLPKRDEIKAAVERTVKPAVFKKIYEDIYKGDKFWDELTVPEKGLYKWEDQSTYIKKPPFFDEMPVSPPMLKDINDARVLALLGDSITTDHISPAGSIPPDSPAAKYLISCGVKPTDFNSFGSRRGNYEVMIRGTFGNIRLKNLLTEGKEGDYTIHLPDKKLMRIYNAAIIYKTEDIPLIVIAGKEYGSGSSRDWAAKGPMLLGVKAVLAEGFERIHRSNLIGMGILPLEFEAGETQKNLNITGTEKYSLSGITDICVGKIITITAADENGRKIQFNAKARIDTPQEVEYYKHGGILQYVMRKMQTPFRQTPK